MTEATSGRMYSQAVPLHTSDVARARLAKRYAAERRFQLYGILAILLAIGFLALLLGTVIFKGLPAFTQYVAALELDLSRDSVDPRSPEATNFNGLINEALFSQMPFLDGRAERRAAASLISSGANILLRNRVLDEPALLGAARPMPILLDDYTDLYLKGLLTRVDERTGQGTLTIETGENGAVTLRAGAPVFADIVAGVTKRLFGEARELERRIAGQTRSLTAAQGAIAALEAELTTADSARQAVLEQQIAAARGTLVAAQTQIKALKAQLVKTRARAEDPSAVEALTGNDASYFVRLGDGVVKLTSASPEMATGEIFIPIDTAAARGDVWQLIIIDRPESLRKFNDRQIAYIEYLRQRGIVKSSWNSVFFTAGASREAEMAGIWGAVVGSFYTMLVTLILSFPVGVAAAIYLEEFAPKNRLTDLIEVNINNLAAVPSIVFGLLGLAVILNIFGLPRSAPIAGGIVLSLMTLPTIIIASRAALKAVPPSIREAALAVGASKQQAVFHHVVPLALPGMFTGTIIGMAQALGETAPLLMIGMVAFIVDIPSGPLSPATVLPVQIFMWADFPEPAFEYKTSAAIMVLLGFLIIMNAVVVMLRRRFERRW